MTLAALIAYSGALFIAAAIPGPGVTALVARALGSGFRETFFMGLGVILGDMIYLTAVVLGLALIAQTFTTLFLVVKLAGVLYLGYIAWKLWTAGLLPEDIKAKPRRMRRCPSSRACSSRSETRRRCCFMWRWCRR